MKSNLLRLSALVLAIGISSFTARFSLIYYFVYNTAGGGAHNSMSSYAFPTTTVPPTDVGTAQLYYLGIQDINGVAGIQIAEWNAAFAKVDVTTVDNNLNNELERFTSYPLPPFGSGIVKLEKKF